MDQLINKFSELTVVDNRAIQANDHFEVMLRMMDSMDIAADQDVNDLIDNIDCMTINDDSVCIQMNNQYTIIFYENSCKIAYNASQELFYPRWQDSY